MAATTEQPGAAVTIDESAPSQQLFLDRALATLQEGGVLALLTGSSAQNNSQPSQALQGLLCEHGEHSLLPLVTGAGSRVSKRATISSDAILCYPSSGSTGAAKYVVYRGEQIVGHARAVMTALGLNDRGLRYISLTPMCYAYGLSIVLSHALTGLPVHFVHIGSGMREAGVELQEGRRPLALYLLPQQVPLLLNAPIDPGRLERVFIAGGRISRPSVEALAKKFPNLRLTNMYGQAEMGPRLSVWDGDPKDFVEGSIGKPISGVQLKLADEERGRTEPVPLLASSEHAMWKCLKPPYEEFEDGPAPGEFIDTGDLAMRAPDGGLIHCGRGDHVLNVAGTKIDVRRVTRLIEERFRPIVVRITSKPSRVAGDVLPVVEVVPSPDENITKRDVRQTLHADYGNLASLFDVQIVSQLNLGESGK